MSRKTKPRLGTGLVMALALLLGGACGGENPLAPVEGPSAIVAPEEPQARAPETDSRDETPTRPAESGDPTSGPDPCLKECF